MSPAEVKNSRGQLRLKRVEKSCDENYSIFVSHDGSVYLTNQRSGSKPKESIELPRRVFAEFVEWYLKDQG